MYLLSNITIIEETLQEIFRQKNCFNCEIHLTTSKFYKALNSWQQFFLALSTLTGFQISILKIVNYAGLVERVDGNCGKNEKTHSASAVQSISHEKRDKSQ